MTHTAQLSKKKYPTR